MNASITRAIIVAVVISALAFSFILYNPLGTISKTIQQPVFNTQPTTSSYTLGNSTSFGNSYFESPSAVLVAANTLVWANFKLQQNGSSQISGSFVFFAYPNVIGANVTILVYLNDMLAATSSYYITSNHEITNTSLIPSSVTPNSEFALNGVTPTTEAGVLISSETLSLDSKVSFALFSSSPIWLAGWTKADLAAGTGPQYGQSTWQQAGTNEYEGTSAASFPQELPKPTTTIPFELQISGALIF